MRTDEAGLLGHNVWEGVEHWVFYCPGCKHLHSFHIRPDGGHPSWSFNGNTARPTFEPSLLNTIPDQGRVCHLFLRDGQLQFLGDCTHHLAGQTLPLPPLSHFD